MKIFITGLCTLHWGRLEYGNIGNYYIIEPLFRELHRVFPDAEIVTTFQMTNDFIEKENIEVLPLNMYYTWSESDILNAKSEYALAKQYKKIGRVSETTPYIQAIQEVSLLINVSGDMWGDNAEHVGHGRFLVDLLKMRTAQLFGVNTVLFAGTPGPFHDAKLVGFAKEVFSNFNLVINRETTSTQNLEKWEFDMCKVQDFACPAFLFEPESKERACEIMKEEGIEKNDGRMLIGFTIGGFNMPVGPYDMWPRGDFQYLVFAKAIEYAMNELDAKLMLISHTNGFKLPPKFELINGRDYQILKQLQDVIQKRGLLKHPENLLCINKPHLPKETKALIGLCDMFITGRVHASVAAMTQYVPTVFINYEKNFIPSTKMQGFASLAGIPEYVCEPGDAVLMCDKIKECRDNGRVISKILKENIPNVQKKARLAFDAMADIVRDE